MPLYNRSLAIREKALGPNHPAVARAQNNLAQLYRDQGRYADAEPLYKRSLAIRENALGPEHPDVATSLNNLAGLYESQARYIDALPLVRTAAQKGFIQKQIYLDVLTGAVSTSLITNIDALNESYQIVQQATSSAASAAINQLSIRFAAGTDELAQLIRREQDLSAESEGLDDTLIKAFSNESSKRDAAKEQQIREHLSSIAVQRAEIQTTLSQRFPNFTALSKPLPLTVAATAALLDANEALLVVNLSGEMDRATFGSSPR